jgi:hypothetical protein
LRLTVYRQSVRLGNDPGTKTGVLPGRCLRHSFGIPSSPQASFNLNAFPNLCVSQGLTFPNGVPSTDGNRA